MVEQDKDFVEKVKNNYPKNADKILKAYEFAYLAHQGITRKSGEPYITHPVAVASILIDNNMDYATIMAGVLHDVVEDTRFSIDDIKNNFGETVAKLVDGVTKVDNLKYVQTNFTESDSIKRLLIAMGDDIRVIFIKLADRLHNMRTIQFLSREKQIKMATETRDLFIPIAERIGIRSIRSELQNLVFQCLYPEDYKIIEQEFERKFKKREPQIHQIEENLNQILKDNGIDGKIVGWREHYYSIFKKMQRKGISKVYGLMLYKVIVPTELDCYKTLGLFHKQYRHFPSQIFDYISSPKPNGYRSLHSVLSTKNFDVTFKVMIRTPEMDKICEFGVSSLWQDKDADVVFSEQIEKFNNLKNIVLEENQTEDSISFIDAIKTDLSQNVTWAFTPKFKPICLNSESPTAIDFAYAVHTRVGDNAISAVINNKKASLGATVASGDVVSIVLSNEEKAPSRNWLLVVKTAYARKKIREYINKNTTPENVQKGKDLLSAELEGTKYSLGDLTYLYPKIAPEFNFVSLEDMFASVGYKSITVQQLTKYLFEEDLSKECENASPVLVENSSKFINLTFPKCCSAIPGDEIVAVLSKNCISIHTKGCLHLKSIPPEKLLNAKWKSGDLGNFNVKLKISAKDDVGLGAKVLGLFASENKNVTKLEAKKNGENSCEFVISLTVKNTEELKHLTDKVSKIENIKLVSRNFD